MNTSAFVSLSRLAGLLLSASLLGACAMPTDAEDEFAADDMDAEDMAEDVAEASQEIVGGSVASGPYQFPYQVLILQNGSPLCGGTILRNRWILTAAHCVYNASVGQLTVRAGEFNLYGNDGTEQQRSVIAKTLHPNYNDYTLANDIALLELSSGIVQNAAVQKIALPTSPTPLGAVATASGWGDTYQGSAPSQFLRYVQLPIVSDNMCFPPAGSLCAGYVTGPDACEGDSGGPLVLNGTVVGIVSSGSAACNTIGVYTDVYDFRAWIMGITGL